MSEPKTSIVMLKVPALYGSTPYLQISGNQDSTLIDRCLSYLEEHFKEPKIRNPIQVDGVIRACEFHKLDGRDGEAGMRILDYLLRLGYEPERVDVSQSAHGTEVVACVYILRK